MSLPGIWSIEVAGVYGWENRGILIFSADNKRVMGGGRNHYSKGSYKKTGKEVRVKLDVHYYTRDQVVFGAKRSNVSIVFKGKRKGDSITGSIDNVKNSTQSIPARLTKRAELP